MLREAQTVRDSSTSVATEDVSHSTPAAAARRRADLLKAYALQGSRVKRVALAKIASLVAAAKPAGALFGSAVRK
jgi:hypothetical protein